MDQRNGVQAVSRKPKTKWDLLRGLINELDEAARADEMKGGGDPADMESKELYYKLTRAKLFAQIERMERNEDG